MTALMCQVTCALCNIKIDETKWGEHLASSKHREICQSLDHSIPRKFFEMIFEARPEKKKIFNLKNEKSHDFWQQYFSTKHPKEKFTMLCNDSFDKTEIEENLETDFNDFILKVIPIIGKNYFPSLKDKTFCEFCSVEVNIAFLYKHINSKEHKQIENYLIKSSMTYCEVCKKEIRNDEWRDHIISENHLEKEKKGYCKVCKEKYSIAEYNQMCPTTFQQRRISAQNHHYSLQTHKQNQESFDLYFS